MTDKEKMVMDKILEKGSNFNFNKLDLGKTWEQNAEHLEGGKFYAFPDVRDYGCGMEKQVVRGVFGALSKKGMVEIWDEEGIDWLMIGQREFNNIVKEYAGL